jgi:hypothetical protein
LAVARCVAACVAEVDERVEIAIGQRPNATAPATIASIRPAKGDELLAAEADASGTAVAGNDVNDDLVDELHRDLTAFCLGAMVRGSAEKSPGMAGLLELDGPTGGRNQNALTITVGRLLAPFVANSTRPSTSANSE